MASVEAASALLTATSLLIAAFGLLFQQSAAIQYLRGNDNYYLEPIIFFFGVIITASFTFSLLYLHSAVIPNGFAASFGDSESYFDITTGSLILFGCFVMGSIIYDIFMPSS